MRRWLRESRNRLREELREKPAQLLELREIGRFSPMCAREAHRLHVSSKLETFRNSRNSSNHAGYQGTHAQPVAQLAQPHHLTFRMDE
jgi:hypothetical protein